MDVQLRQIPHAFHLPRPNWEVIRDWIQTNVPPSEHGRALADAAAQWLDVLNEALGGTYCTTRGEGLFVFAPQDSPQAEPLTHYIESALEEIQRVLGNLGRDDSSAPLVVMLFANEATYYTYIASFYGDGEFGRSAGMCVRDGYVHVVLHPADLDTIQLVAVHEVTHVCLSHLDLPLWLEEGITQYAERLLHSRAGADLTSAAAGEIRKHFRAAGIDRFWWGAGFAAAGEEQKYCYQLAAVLFRLAAADYRRSLPAFVRDAAAADAGECAAREHLKLALSDLAAKFLGPGEWAAIPPAAAAYCRRGDWHYSRGSHEVAIADFTRATELDPRSGEAYSRRALAFYGLGRYPEAALDYEAAIKRDPRSLHTLNNFAWLLATCPDPQHRDGARAVTYAEQAAELSNYAAWFTLETLAAACAELGDFDEARRWAKESLRLAPEEERESCRQRLRLYRDGRPFHEAPSPTAVS